MTFRSGFLFFFQWMSNCSRTVFEKATLSPLNCFCIFVKNQLGWEFPGCPVVRIQHFHCCKLRLNPWPGKRRATKIKKKKKKKTKENQLGVFVQVCFWVFGLVPLIYVSVLLSLIHCLNYCSNSKP